MRVLVTGAAGFVGTHLLRLLREARHELFATILPHESLAADLAEVPFEKLDIRDEAAVKQVLADFQPQWIAHLAAISRPADCERDAALAWDVNFMGTLNLYRLAAQTCADARVLFVSSSVVYGKPAEDELPIVETAPLRPRGVYAATKAAADLVGAEFASGGRLPVLRARPFNHIGPGQETGFVAADFARQVALIEKGEQAPVLQVGNLDSERDFTDARDVIRAYLDVLAKGRPGDVYNVCSGEPRPVRDLLDGLLALIDTKVDVQVDPSRIRSNDIDRIFGSAQRLHDVTKWTPRIPWEQTLYDLLDDWRGRV